MQRLSGLAILFLLLFFTQQVTAQAPRRYTSAELLDAIQKLQFLGSALYVAAHPDDENTRLITYLANVKDANTGYLSLTRGDGGQNLVGPEMGEMLGVIRTQELLAARRIDGGRQFFSRANDFGFSKHPDETFSIWNRAEVLADAVWVIRNFQPDIIVNRFDHRTPGSTHGHHTGSAIISVEAFDKAADPTAFPEQLNQVKTWQPKRLFFNTTWWFYGSPERFRPVADSLGFIRLDVNQYLPTRGESVSEIAARSRSQHSSQGFGSAGARGSELEYLELLKGEPLGKEDDLFKGINTTWSRVQGGTPIGDLLREVEKSFDYNYPERSVPGLLHAYQLIKALPDGHWKRIKQREIEEVLAGALGLFLEVTAADASAAPGRAIELRFEAINRSNIRVQLDKVRLLPLERDTVLQAGLPANEGLRWNTRVLLPATLPYSNAYWLDRERSLGMYNVPDQLRRGQPETPAPLRAAFDLKIYDEKTQKWEPLSLTKAVVYKETDPAKGEVYQPFQVTPPVFVNLDQSAYIFASNEPKEVVVKVTAGRDSINGKLVLVQQPSGWVVKPDAHEVQLLRKGQEQSFTFQLYPPATQVVGSITPIFVLDGKEYSQSLHRIEYPHIPLQTVLLDATTRAVRLDLKKRGERIAYVMGAGDDIPAALRQIGYQVDLLSAEELQPERLRSYHAVIMGVRAYNTLDKLAFYQANLLDYVKSGGTMIVQYNTSNDLKVPMPEIGPYPLKISRERVAVENAEVRLLAPDHPALNVPNKITAADFEGWVQERGLYFANEWDERYTPLLSSNDPGEPARDGGLLVAAYGEGHFVYTGYSWFRELPAGVPGAYRLFANLISLGQETEGQGTMGQGTGGSSRQ